MSKARAQEAELQRLVKEQRKTSRRKNILKIFKGVVGVEMHPGFVVEDPPERASKDEAGGRTDSRS